MMDRSGDHDAGETSAVKSKIQPMQHVVTIHIAIGAVLVLVELGGRTLPNDSVKNKTVCPWRA